MKVYLSYFKLKFITGLQYRTAAIAGISTQIFFGLVNVLVYIAFYKSGDSNVSMSLSQTITYLWLNQAFLILIFQFYRDTELYELIKSGNLSYELARPQNLYWMWYFKILATRASQAVLRFLPALIFAFLIPIPYKMSLPVSISSFILFVVALFLGTILITAISTLYPIIVIKTLNEKGVVNIFSAFGDILGGLAVPIPFFPKFIAAFSKYLPFQYVSDLPFRIYIGNIGIKDAFNGIFIQLFWIATLILIGYIVLQKLLKNVSVQGG
ncbi:MAG: ABC-2 family transporter protein [Erysipelotrichales bacterium]|nr:ABC-2 family transporter protein [Erysipelotrichales bacterium]